MRASRSETRVDGCANVGIGVAGGCLVTIFALVVIVCAGRGRAVSTAVVRIGSLALTDGDAGRTILVVVGEDVMIGRIFATRGGIGGRHGRGRTGMLGVGESYRGNDKRIDIHERKMCLTRGGLGMNVAGLGIVVLRRGDVCIGNLS